MHSLAILALIRNEASRWLPSVLEAWSQFADVCIALDDGSDDGTPSLLKSCTKVEYHRRHSDGMWGQEAPARAELWQLGVASGADWLMVLDADMVPACSPRPLLAEQADAVAFRLFDLWHLQPALYRSDGFWRAHECYRIWAVRNPGPGFAAEWPARGIHCGHFPMNLPVERCIYAPLEHSLLHFAYSDKDERRRKLEQYSSKAMQLTRAEQLHAASIGDNLVTLQPLPIPMEYEIVKAAL